jgi:hypothetical protein
MLAAGVRAGAKAAAKAAARLGEAGAELAGKDIARGMAVAGKTGLKDADTVLAEGVGDMASMEAKASAGVGMKGFENSMEAAGNVAKDTGTAAARATAKEAGAAVKATEKLAAKKGSSLAAKAGAKAKSALKANKGKIGLTGLGAAAAGISSIVGVVMAGNTANDVVNKGEEAVKATRDGIIELLDPMIHTPLAAMGWSDDKIATVEKAAANAAMFGGLIVTVYMVHRAFN